MWANRRPTQRSHGRPTDAVEPLATYLLAQPPDGPIFPRNGQPIAWKHLAGFGRARFETLG
jgi:hypothetical protein